MLFFTILSVRISEFVLLKSWSTCVLTFGKSDSIPIIDYELCPTVPIAEVVFYSGTITDSIFLWSEEVIMAENLNALVPAYDT